MLLKSHAPRWNKPFLVNVLYWRPLSLIKYSASHLYIYFFRKALKEGSFSKNELSPCSVREPDQCWPQKDDFLLCRKRMFGLCWPVSRYSQIPRPSAPFAWICPSILHSNIQKYFPVFFPSSRRNHFYNSSLLTFVNIWFLNVHPPTHALGTVVLDIVPKVQFLLAIAE